jgi:uncharacterized protein YjiS (DUF1127 family)
MAYIQTHNRPARRFSVLAMLGQMHSLARQRTALRGLDAAQLRDVNITAEAAQKEANRPFWDAPDYMR